MEWDYDFKIQVWRFALLRKKDRYMVGENAKRWAIGFKNFEGCWKVTRFKI